MSWLEASLVDLANFRRGHDLSRGKMKEGEFIVAGSNGAIGNHNEYTTKGPGLTIGRSGNIGNPYFYQKDFWAHNTVLYVDDFKDNWPKYVYYFLKTIDFKQFNAGSAVPTLNRNHIHSIKINIPPLQEQKAIAEILSSLDDKIELLQKQNETLEALAQTLFRQWFIEEADDSWEEVELGSLIELLDSKRIPLSKMQREEMKEGKMYPYYGAASIMDYVNEYLFDFPTILLGEDGTVINDDGTPIIQFANGKYWVNNHAHVVYPKNPKNMGLLLTLLKQLNVRSIVSGAVQPKINQGNLKKLSLNLSLDKYQNSEINKVFNDFLEKQISNENQIETLKGLRDTLLPKLMSGQVRVKLD